MYALLRWNILFWFVLLCTSTAAADGSGPAGPKLEPNVPVGAPLVVVVDVQRILDESQAAKSVQKQLESQRAHFQSEIESEENELRQAEQDLTKAHQSLNADTYSDREAQLRQRFLEEERHVQARRKALDQAFSDSMNTVHSILLDIVKDVAREHRANLVLIKQQVLWTEKSLDATDEILGRLNAKMPTITVKMPSEEQDVPAAK